MRGLFAITVFAAAIVLSGCGSSNSVTGQDAGKAFFAAFGAASTSTQSGHMRLVREALNQARHKAMTESWIAMFDSVHRHEQGRTAQWCDDLTPQSGTGMSCTETCPGNVFTTNCALTSSFTAKCGATTYTASGGSVSMSWPNGNVTDLASTAITIGMDITLSGGNFSNTELKLGFTFNFADFSQADPTNFCSHIQNFTATAGGSSFTCEDLANGITQCGS